MRSLQAKPNLGPENPPPHRGQAGHGLSQFARPALLAAFTDTCDTVQMAEIVYGSAVGVTPSPKIVIGLILADIFVALD
jgi:hypothetical protein